MSAQEDDDADDLAVDVTTDDSPVLVGSTSILDLPHGLYQDYPAERYHARIPGMASKSALDLVHRSLAHYQAWVRGSERAETKALAFGKALHCAVLEADVFRATYIVQPDFGDCRTKEPKARRDVWRRHHGIDDKGRPRPGGRTPLPADDLRVINGISASIHRHKFASRMIADGASEVTMRWKDPTTGIECKGRVDYYVPQFAAAWDVKTTEDARSPAFSKSIALYRYHVQHAFYADAFRALGRPLDYFAFIAAEKSEPYNVKLFMLDPDEIAAGYEEAQADLAALAKAYETNEFDGYDESIEIIRRPEWARRST